MLSVEMLTAIMPTLAPAKAAQYLPYLVAGMKEFRIDNELRVSAFISQLAEESQQLTHWEENLNYTHASRIHAVWPKRFPTEASAAPYVRNPKGLAEKVYGGRADLGNTQPGDGWTFHGRGPIQTTGRFLYGEIGDLLGEDLISYPEKINDPEIAFRAAAAIFARIKGCNVLADGLINNPNNLRIVTKRINGGYTGLADRLEYYRRARKVLPDNLQLSGVDIVIAPPKIDAGESGNASTVLKPEEPAGSTSGPQTGPPNMDVETGNGEDTAAQALASSTEPAADQGTHLLKLEDWKPLVKRWMARVWTIVSGANITQAVGFVGAAAKDPPNWFIYFGIALAVFLVLLLGGAIVSGVLLLIWYFNRKEINTAKMQEALSHIDPKVANLKLQIVGK